ncbi:MAG: hypothetical protein LC808_02775 [Actinobacteria bacterium]|nr:hypothetical protein [Actinomycetota bacterium]
MHVQGEAEHQIGPFTVTGSAQHQAARRLSMESPRAALLIVSGDYRDASIRGLCPGGPRVTRLQLALQNPAIGDFGAVPIHLNPTASTLTAVIEQFLGGRDPAHQLLLYLSAVVVNEADGRSFVATSDTRAEQIASTAVGVGFLREQLDRCGARHVTVVADCTYVTRVPGTAELRPASRMSEGIAGDGRCVLASVQAEVNATSGAVPYVLSRAILEAIKGSSADGEDNGVVQLDEVLARVRDALKETTPGQVPDVFDPGGVAGKIAIARSQKVRLKAALRWSDPSPRGATRAETPATSGPSPVSRPTNPAAPGLPTQPAAPEWSTRAASGPTSDSTPLTRPANPANPGLTTQPAAPHWWARAAGETPPPPLGSSPRRTATAVWAEERRTSLRRWLRAGFTLRRAIVGGAAVISAVAAPLVVGGGDDDPSKPSGTELRAAVAAPPTTSVSVTTKVLQRSSVTTTPQASFDTTPVHTPAPSVVVSTPPTSFTTVTTNPVPRPGERLTGDCPEGTSFGSNVRAAPHGTTVSTGTLVVVRSVDKILRTEWLQHGCLARDVFAGEVGDLSYEVWQGFTSVAHAGSHACGQAVLDTRDAAVPDSWNYQYDVRLLGPDGRFTNAPASCPAY